LRLPLLLIVFAALAAIFINPAYASEEVSIATKSVSVGEEVELPITLNTVPKGLAGYEISLEVEDPSVAEIVDVRFPDWAKLSDSSIKANSAVLKAVDLEDKVKAEVSSIELAAVKIKAAKPGETTIKLAVIKMDDDEGNPITPSVKQEKLSVTAAKRMPLPLELYAAVIVAAVASASAASIIHRRRRKSG
jgi:hypothetical protein